MQSSQDLAMEELKIAEQTRQHYIIKEGNESNKGYHGFCRIIIFITIILPLSMPKLNSCQIHNFLHKRYLH